MFNSEIRRCTFGSLEPSVLLRISKLVFNVLLYGCGTWSSPFRQEHFLRVRIVLVLD
jgi:hypothetical protein